MTADQAGDDIAKRICALEERARAAIVCRMIEDIADRVITLANIAPWIRAGSSRTPPGVGSLESFTTVVDALAADLKTPRAAIVRHMIEDLDERIDLDRAVLAHLHRIEEAERTC